MRPRVLFLCTANSCRSQMAEGFCRSLRGSELEAFSAGLRAGTLDPRAVAVMAEVGVDISKQRSKSVDELRGLGFDLVVTVCDGAHESCPVLPGARRLIHHGFDDPPRLVADVASEAEARAVYRRVRDEIRGFVEKVRVVVE